MLPKLTFIGILSLLFPHFVSNAQTVEVVGTENTFEVATWNIEWFGNSGNGPSNEQLQFDNVKAVIEGSEIDLWGVQEIANQNDFNALVASLGSNYSGSLATNSGDQRIGFIYNTDVVRDAQVRHVLTNFEFEFAFRPPLQLDAEVTLPDTTVSLSIIVMHMKAFSDTESYNRRVDASIALKDHIDNDRALAEANVIILGDLNDELSNSISGSRDSPYENFLLDTANFDVLTFPLESAGEGSFCSNSLCTSTGSFLDHIIITNELFSSYIANSIGFIPNLVGDINFFGSTTSDHLPVVAMFDFGQMVPSSTESESIADELFLELPYPNPFTRSTALTFRLAIPKHVTVEVFDLLGRKIKTLTEGTYPVGTHQLSFTLEGSPNGIYLMRIKADGFVKAVPVTFVN